MKRGRIIVTGMVILVGIGILLVGWLVNPTNGRTDVRHLEAPPAPAEPLSAPAEPELEPPVLMDSEDDACSNNTASAIGYVLGRSTLTLRNRYASFVSKVNFYTGHHVKQGDVILEFDDLPLRRSITNLKHRIAEQEMALESHKLALELTLLNPLPSEYRNLPLKHKIAQEAKNRLVHEFEVYDKLHHDEIVSDLVHRQKREAARTAEIELSKMDSDMAILEKGLTDLYIKRAETCVREAEIKLKDMQEELELLCEEQKYYRIVAPFDGYCVVNYDPQNYCAAGSAVAEVHRDDRKRVYAYFPENSIRHIRIGQTLQFVSNQYPDDQQGFEVSVYEVKKNRYDYGTESFFLVKCHLATEPHPLKIGSIGTVLAPMLQPHTPCRQQTSEHISRNIDFND